MKPRTVGQSFALALVAGIVSSVAVGLLLSELAARRERAQASAPLPGPIVPGFGSA